MQDSARGWVVVAAAFVAMFTVFGVAYSFGAFFTPMAEEFGVGRGATSIVFSITAFMYFMLGIWSGRATDRFGPRPVLVVGALAMGAGLALTSAAPSLWLGYITYGLGVGLGVACGYVPMVATVGGWFERSRGMALGIAVSGIGFGTLGVAPLAGALIRVHGWRTTYLVFGIASTILLLGCAALAQRAPASDQPGALRLREVVRTRAFLVLYLSGLLMSLALFVPFVFLPPFAEEHGVSKVAAAALVGAIGGASIVGRLGLGTMADRLGRIRTYQGCFGVMAASYAVWLSTTSYGWLVTFAVIMGIGYGGFIALSPAVIAELFGLAGLGGLIGASYTSAALGALLGPPAAGFLIDATGGYRPAIAMAMGLAAASFLVLLPLSRLGADVPTTRSAGGG